MKRIVVGLMVLAVLALAVPAHAALQLRLFSNATATTPITTLTDGDGDGSITFSGAVGAFNIVVSTGVSYPAIGSPTIPKLDLNNVSISSTGAGSMRIEVSNDGFVYAPTGMEISVGGTTNGTVDFAQYIDLSNTLFGKTTAGPTLGPYVGTPATVLPFAGKSSQATPGSPSAFSMTLVATVVHSGAGATSFNLNGVMAPEPGTCLIWALLLPAGLAIQRWRKRLPA